VSNTLEGWTVRDDCRDRRDSWSGSGRWDEQLRGCRLERLSDLSRVNHIGGIIVIFLNLFSFVFDVVQRVGKRLFDRSID
jgi:hypothetical protein